MIILFRGGARGLTIRDILSGESVGTTISLLYRP
jgi:hypothetical protein